MDDPRKWRVVYAKDGYSSNRASVLMSLEDAWNYLNIFKDALYITDGETRFDRNQPPRWFHWLMACFGL